MSSPAISHILSPSSHVFSHLLPPSQTPLAGGTRRSVILPGKNDYVRQKRRSQGGPAMEMELPAPDGASEQSEGAAGAPPSPRGGNLRGEVPAEIAPEMLHEVELGEPPVDARPAV